MRTDVSGRIDLSGGITPATTRVMNLSQFLTQAARRLGDDTGLVWGDTTWTWAQVEARSAAIAAALVADFGVQKGDRILVQSANCNQMFEAMFACWRVGAIWVPANYRQSPDEVAWLAGSSQARGLICGAAFADHARACADQVDFTISIGAADFGSDYDALTDRHMGSAPSPVDVQRDDPCWFFFTSGTTGKPKAAVLTHGQMAFVATNHMCDLMPDSGPDDASIVVAPLSHGAGVHQLAQVAKGVKTILPPGERFDPATIWALVEKWRVTNAFTVPTIVKMLVEHPAVDLHDHSSLRYVIYAGAPMYRADQITALQKLGPVLAQYFGLGEVTGNITVLPPAQHFTDERMRIGTCGFARTGMQVQIQDAAGAEVALGGTGEICVIGPAVFAGYFNNPDANAKAFRNGWFLTGDLGHMDADGYVYLTGRASDMYISGGSNIYPREIEEKLLLHPQVSECAILGVPDPLWGEVGLAVVVPVPGADAAQIDVVGWLSGQVAKYKLPKVVVFWEALPKSGYGKITKKLIHEELVRRGELPGQG
ncbi:acyl-CoA synthetase [Roseicitreum antarcticum]|uniref:Acyl-CoA synthetase (AMP-forming)/AMP-acid ligase II n=1 Tax=Roseicitreum antarcticum TaxID=564137 RepID=A0A1H3AYU0_9RHOB|nr:acyl-CoA synthetase [Roseicitreum antarcticum]SDX34900.1 Acyl-CoA synthetase (AMP-forming)/AMP-acid ligase II [Roseicitreum antarcticum]